MLKNYYQGIREQRATLAQKGQQFFFVTSLGTPGRHTTPGTVAEVTLDIAARLLHEGSHRLSTDAEIEEFRRRQAFNRAPDPVTDTLASARARFEALMAGKGKQ
jgi:hypothetical protein